MTQTRRIEGGAVLTVGFGAAVALWTFGYLSRFPGSHLPPAALFFGLIVLLLLAGALAGLRTRRPIAVAALGGALAGLLNLLVLGGAIKPAQETSMPSPALWLPGSIAATSAALTLGALLAAGMRRRWSQSEPPNHPLAFALVACGATLVLLSVGGVVTGFEAGLAVPDWPNSYGYNMFLFPLSRMTGGVYFEHAHRLFGALVGATTVTLAIYLGWVERRRWVRWIGVLAALMVIGQGVLGGLRVTGRLTLSTMPATPNLALAVVHGVFGQLFFCTLAVLASTLTRAWRELAPPGAPIRSGQRDLAIAAAACILVQLVLGAILRHTSTGLHLHIATALLASGIAGTAAVRAWAGQVDGPISRLGFATLIVLMCQIVLGLFALAVVMFETPGQPRPVHVLFTTAHQTMGAVLLALTVLLAVWRTRELAVASQRGFPIQADPREATSLSP